MTLKLLGAVLVLAGCGGFGFAMASSYCREEYTLAQLARALEYMSCELSYRMTPLPQLCRNAANAVTGVIHSFFLTLAEELEQQVAPDAQMCMNAALAAYPGLPISVRLQLGDLGQTLGRFDLPGQIRGIEGCLHSAQSAAQELAREKSSRLRNYQTLGLCAGAALAILFL